MFGNKEKIDRLEKDIKELRRNIYELKCSYGNHVLRYLRKQFLIHDLKLVYTQRNEQFFGYEHLYEVFDNDKLIIRAHSVDDLLSDWDKAECGMALSKKNKGKK